MRKKPPTLSSLTEQFSPWWRSGTEKVSETLRKTRETALKQGSEVLKQGSEVLRQGSAAALKSGTDVLKTTEEAIKTGGEVIKQGGEVLLSTGEKTLGTLLNKEREAAEPESIVPNQHEASSPVSSSPLPIPEASEDVTETDAPTEENDE